jgi:hypothetical protein
MHDSWEKRIVYSSLLFTESVMAGCLLEFLNDGLHLKSWITCLNGADWNSRTGAIIFLDIPPFRWSSVALCDRIVCRTK